MNGRYGNWGKHVELFDIYESFNEDPAVIEQWDELMEGTGAPEGRADFPIFLQTVIRNRMRERFATVAAKWDRYMGIESAQDFREHTVTQMNGLRGMGPVNEDGEYKRLRSSEEVGPSFAVGKHGGTYAVTMELVINDETDVILNRIPRELGRHSSEYISQAVIAFIESNPTYPVDDQPFFGTAHDNEVTGADADANETNLMAILDMMKLRRDRDNIPFTVEPNRIIVRTPSQKATFDRIIRSQLTGVTDAVGAGGNAGLGFGQFFTGNLNPAYNVLPPDAVIDEPWLNDPKDWYVLGDAESRAPFVIAFLRGRREPFIGLKDQGVRDAMGAGSDPYSWWFDSIDYKIRHFFGVATGEPLAAFRARPS
jgi:hypothetical protein